MVSFSQFEKNIIKDIIALDKEAGNALISLQNIISKSSSIESASDYYIEVASSGKSCIMIKLEANSLERLEEVDKHFALNILPCALLLSKLEKSGLIFSMGEDDKSIVGDFWEKEKYIPYRSMGNKAKDIVFQYSSKNFYITESLKELVEKDFMTEADRQHKRELDRADENIKLSKRGLGISIAAVFISIAANAVFSYNAIFGTTSVNVVNAIERESVKEKECENNAGENFLFTLFLQVIVKNVACGFTDFSEFYVFKK